MTGAGHPSVKITVPHAMARTVDRPALRQRLDTLTRDHRVVVVSAPAGYGKTTALAQWAAKETRAVAWLSLDPFDDDPRRLFGGLLASLRAAFPEPPAVAGAPARTALRDLRPPGAGARLRQSHVDALLVAIEQLGEPLVLVLDDVHVLHTPEARDLLAGLARYLPAGAHLVVAARYDPPLPVQRLRAAGDLGVLRREDLAFEEDQVALVVAELGLEVDVAAIHELARTTAGWPAAVRLTGLALRDAPDPGARIRELAVTSMPLADYLLEEVVGTLEPDVAAFVLDATAVRRIDADLARALHGDRGPALLDQCVRSGLFLAAFERAGLSTSYRWHELFAAQCQDVLRRSDPARFGRVHRTAALALASSDLAEAVTHAATAGVPELASRLLLAGWSDAFVAGETGTLRKLVDAVSGPERDAADIVLVEAACRVLDGDPSADTLLTVARERRDRLPGERRAAFDVAEALVTLYVARENGSPTDRHAALAGGRSLLQASERLASSTRALACYLVGSAEARLAYDDAAALVHLREGARLAAEAGSVTIEVSCLAESAVALFGTGDVEAAQRVALDVLRRAERLGWNDSTAIAPAFVALGLVAHAHDRFDEAASALRQAIRLTRTRSRVVGLRAAVVLMAVSFASGDAGGLAEARAAVAERANLHELEPTIVDVARVIEARVLVEAGDVRGAVAILRDLGPCPRMGVVRVWEADVYRRAGLFDEAWRTLEAVPRQLRHAELSVTFDLTTALLHHAAGDARQAHESLETALDAGEERGILRPFGERGPELAALLGAHLTWGTQHEAFVGARLSALASRDDTRRTAAYWELTERENEVLLYLRSPMTAADIAAALFVSVNTVKTHQRAIYRKLGVSGRRDAVRIAFERGLLAGA
ncbi:LuxR C-terminal-related transcriptional regulator [Luteimicrobium xylanilyticum]|uniref:Serine/threonine-protein kinase PknK n=1 Tax=Luteimicrobium xylanilyticum TaxID=1133546 RepID=A0A5P9Q6C4_9MICO|nr:LuxR C-terminal-related transcriptional regulator [Luteimicrobium xylanilyticum]QFU96826.1 Serine/threonine-protein kinase PknK [Luteimicrobium xylanilyticum]